MGFQCIIHQMKGIIFLYMLIYLILKININVKVNKRKCIYLTFIFRSSISHQIMSLTVWNFACMWVTFMSRELCLRLFFYVLLFILCKKTGNFLHNLLNIFSNFSKRQTRTYIKILRHSSLTSDVFNVHLKFQICNFYNKRDIHVQKIKVKK